MKKKRCTGHVALFLPFGCNKERQNPAKSAPPWELQTRLVGTTTRTTHDVRPLFLTILNDGLPSARRRCSLRRITPREPLREAIRRRCDPGPHKVHQGEQEALHAYVSVGQVPATTLRCDQSGFGARIAKSRQKYLRILMGGCWRPAISIGVVVLENDVQSGISSSLSPRGDCDALFSISRPFFLKSSIT